MAHAPASARIAVTGRPVWDAWALGLVVALAAWLAWGAGRGTGRPLPVIALLAGLVLAVVVGRMLGERLPAVLAVTIAGAVVVTWPGVLSAAGGPTGYANTNATLAGLGALSATGAALVARDRRARRAWWTLLVGLVLVVVATGSVAGSISLVVGLALAAVALRTRWPATVIVGGSIVVSAVLGVTAVIASGGDPMGLAGRAGVRAQLWTGAWQIAESHPWRGLGPGEFEAANPITSDADLRWVHNGYLQILAEWGIAGFVLAGGIAGWVWARLWCGSGSRPTRTSIVAAAVVLVGLHATVDYVFHVPAVLVALAALVGWATAAPLERRECSTSRSEPDESVSRFLDS